MSAKTTRAWTSIIWDDSRYTTSLLLRKCTMLRGQLLDPALMRYLHISEWQPQGTKVRRTLAQLPDFAGVLPKVRSLLELLVGHMPLLDVLIVFLSAFREKAQAGRTKVATSIIVNGDVFSSE